MAKIQVTKIQAAQRQIDCAIRLLFDNGDAVSIHTLGAAGHRILRDLSAKKGTPMHQNLTDIIQPGMEKEFWAFFNRPANFFKHADSDSEAVLDDIDEKVNEHLLFIACLFYRDLAQELTRPMSALVHWTCLLNPRIMKPDHPFQTIIGTPDHKMVIALDRVQKLAFGKKILDSIPPKSRRGS